MHGGTEVIRLSRSRDQVLARIGDADPQPVSIVWARPISGRGQEISLLGKDKNELAMLTDLSCLDPESRRVAEEELERRYLVPKITRVIAATANLGNRYWHVATDHGERRFLMKDPAANTVWITDDHLLICDTLGNRYEISALTALDSRSQIMIDMVL